MSDNVSTTVRGLLQQALTATHAEALMPEVSKPLLLERTEGLARNPRVVGPDLVAPPEMKRARAAFAAAET